MRLAVLPIRREEALEWFRRNRRRSAELFSLIPDRAWLDRPIALRNPIGFYEGHLPAFNLLTLWIRALKEPGLDAELEKIFERGIDPDVAPDPGRDAEAWPSRERTVRFAGRADALVELAILERPLERADNPLLWRGQALYTMLEHEPMHHETLHYMWRRLPYDRKLAHDGVPAPVTGDAPPPERMVPVPAGSATLGAAPDEIPFGWDNEFPRHAVEVPEFSIGEHDVTNAAFLEFIEAGGYGREDLWSPEGWEWVRSEGVSAPPFWVAGKRGWEWLGMFDRIPLPPAWPAWVSQAEAAAFARWRGARLPSEPEYHRAAFGEPSGRERAFPWGEDPADATRGNFDFRHWEPVPVGSFPAGASAWGIHDLVGNGWEWTSTVFGGFPGFEPMASYPQYSADFFDGKHYVMKGASPVTARELVRRSFRNWFRPTYPHVYAAFRLAADGRP
ncbi:MAG: SUMF1/EgtB/PvdO family nonheme iron enzyme [Acidobacteriota bacterium]